MKQLLVLFFLLCSVCISAQDIIVMKDGSTIASKVIEVGQNEIKYKKFNNQDGPLYSISKSSVQSINYQNGAKDTFSSPVREDNRYLPNNQNDGVQQYNDKALLQMDATISHSHNYKTAATISRIFGWGIGAVAVGTGIYFLAFNDDHPHYKGMGAGIAAAGVAWTSGFLLLANHFDKKGREIVSASIYQYNFNFNNGTTLSASMDIINDHTISSKTLGLGLRYNF